MACRLAHAQTAAALLTVLLAVFHVRPDGQTDEQTRIPELRFETVGREQGSAARLGRIAPERLSTIVRLVGLDDPGDPIGVVLASEETDVARETPSWVAGFAAGAAGTIVLFPARSPRYPHDSLESVFYHEVAHVLISRAAGGRPVPRWFNEGLATVAERTWQFDDRRHLAWALITRGADEMDRLEEMFQQGPPDSNTAYALSTAFIRHVMDVHGGDAPARILSAVADGAPFETAFVQTTGVSLPNAEVRFRHSLRSWERVIPLLTSPLIIWMAVSLLALWAIVVGRRRRAERRRQWDEEEEPGSG